MKKKLIVLLFIFLTVFAGINISADNNEERDRSEDFIIDQLTIKFDSKVVYEYGKENTSDNLEISGNYNIYINLKWMQKDTMQNDFVAGDYVIFKIFEGTNVGNAKLMFTSTGGQLQEDDLILANYKLITEKNGDKFDVYYKVIFTDAIEGRNSIKGTLAGQTTHSGNDVGNTITYSRDEEAFANVETTPSEQKEEKPAGITNPKDIEEQGKTGTSHNGTVQWRIPVTDMLKYQFLDYINSYATTHTNLIIEEELDAYQSFTKNNASGMRITYPVYLYDPNSNYNNTTELITLSGSFINEHISNGLTSLTAKFKNEETSIEDARAYIHATPKTYAIVLEEDPNNPGMQREVLIANFGAPGSTGVRFGDINKSKLEKEITRMKNALENAESVIAGAGNVSGDTVISDQKSGTSGTLDQWKNMRDTYEASIEYYDVRTAENELVGPYVYGMLLGPSTSSNQEQVIADKISRVYNKVKIIHGTIENEYDSWVKVSFFNTISAKYSTGDVVLFKEDARYNNTIDALDKATSFEGLGLMSGIEFVVKDTTGNVMKFDYNTEDGKYTYKNNGQLNVITTDENGMAVITGLDNNTKYFVSELDVEGYYTNQNQNIEVMVDYREISFVLASNHVRGVSFIKTDSIDTDIKLSGAVFELYKYDSDIEDGIKVTGFEVIEINGTTYYAYDKSTNNALITGKDGMLRVTNLAAGNYYFKEVEAPENYLVSDEIYLFELTDTMQGDAIIEMDDITNVKIVNEVPEKTPETDEETPTKEIGERPNTGVNTNQKVMVIAMLSGLALLMILILKKPGKEK